MANLRVDKITSTETFEKTGSVQFDASSGTGLVVGSSDCDFGTGDFTIEGWFLVQDSAAIRTIFDSRTSDNTSTGFFLGINTDDTLYTYGFPSGATVVSYGTPEPNTWHHVAVARNGSDGLVFLDGKLVSSGVKMGSSDYTQEGGTIGQPATSFAAGLYRFKGHISNVRVVKGTALYTSNFKPPMRELEVVPGTVVLACQSKTDASLEKTGKTITVNGTAVANELTPGLLTPIVKSGGGSAITGSVEFDGSGDYLTIPNTEDLRLADSDFTIEFWATISKVDSTYSPFALFENSSALRSYQLEVRSNGAVRFEWWYNGSSGNDITTGTGAVIVNEWYHYAVSRNGATLKLFINGIEVGSSDVGTNSFFNNTVTPFIIGGMFQSDVQQQKWQGNISNFRINKGTALYTADFIPPTRELKKVPGTVLLCCQDSNDPTQEATGKTISLNGIYTYDTVVNSGITTAPGPSNFTPQVGDDRQVTFEGVTKINSDAYFYLPTGDTITRDTGSGRGLLAGGITPTRQNTIEFVNIASTGNTQDFGDLTRIVTAVGGCASATRGLFGGGYNPSVDNNAIEFVTIATAGNAVDFGDLLYTPNDPPGGLSNNTRGIFAGGEAPAGVNNINFVTISTLGDATDFGDLLKKRRQYFGSCSSPTRGLFAGGYDDTSPASRTNVIEYITIATAGNGLNFGDLNAELSFGISGVSSKTRGVFMGGYAAPAGVNTIQYVTIATTGNAQDFGDLTISYFARGGGVSNSERGLAAGGANPSLTNTIDYITIATTGDAQDFGDLLLARRHPGGCSDSHGGLG